MPVIEIKDIRKSFIQGHKTIEVLKGFDLTLEAGEMVGLVGASGSGKSTLLQLAGLLDRPTSGSITVDGNEVTEADDKTRTDIRKSNLGFVYQFHHLLPDFTALENVHLALEISGKGKMKDRAREILIRMGLEDRLDHVPAALSGGEQQRVAIARAIVAKPLLLLADEPTGNLDEATAGRVFETFLELVREEGLTALIATHDQALADRMDRKLVLKEGRVITA